MAVSAPHDPPIRAGDSASPLQFDSRSVNRADPCFVPRAWAHRRFVPENKDTVPDLDSSKLLEFELQDMARRRVAAANRLTEEVQFAKLQLLVEVANRVWNHKSESPAAVASAAPASD